MVLKIDLLNYIFNFIFFNLIVIIRLYFLIRKFEFVYC